MLPAEGVAGHERGRVSGGSVGTRQAIAKVRHFLAFLAGAAQNHDTCKTGQKASNWTNWLEIFRFLGGILQERKKQGRHLQNRANNNSIEVYFSL